MGNDQRKQSRAHHGSSRPAGYAPRSGHRGRHGKRPAGDRQSDGGKTFFQKVTLSLLQRTGRPTYRDLRPIRSSMVGVPSILYVGILLVLATPAKYLLAQLPYSPGAAFADLRRAFSGADSGAFAEIGGGVAWVQGNEISGGSGSAFAQALRPFACAFANVLTALAGFLAGAGLSLVVLALRPGLRLRSPLILW